MAAEIKPARISVEEYLELETASDVKHEYVDGYMILMAWGSRNHSRLAVRAVGALDRRLADGSCRAYNSEVRVWIEDRYFYPDVTVSCDERDAGEGNDVRYPSVIFEVLSPRTEAYDRGDKFDLYQECRSLREYVLVNMRRPEIQVYRRSDDGWVLRTFRAGGNIELNALDLHIPVDEIYEGIDLPAEEPWRLLAQATEGVEPARSR
jgi:Uma2 family endonuclease